MSESISISILNPEATWLTGCMELPAEIDTLFSPNESSRPEEIAFLSQFKGVYIPLIRIFYQIFLHNPEVVQTMIAGSSNNNINNVDRKRVFEGLILFDRDCVRAIVSELNLSEQDIADIELAVEDKDYKLFNETLRRSGASLSPISNICVKVEFCNSLAKYFTNLAITVNTKILTAEECDIVELGLLDRIKSGMDEVNDPSANNEIIKCIKNINPDETEKWLTFLRLMNALMALSSKFVLGFYGQVKTMLSYTSCYYLEKIFHKIDPNYKEISEKCKNDRYFDCYLGRLQKDFSWVEIPAKELGFWDTVVVPIIEADTTDQPKQLLPNNMPEELESCKEDLTKPTISKSKWGKALHLDEPNNAYGQTIFGFKISPNQIEAIFEVLVDCGCIDNTQSNLDLLATRLSKKAIIPEDKLSPITWYGEKKDLCYFIQRIAKVDSSGAGTFFARSEQYFVYSSGEQFTSKSASAYASNPTSEFKDKLEKAI